MKKWITFQLTPFSSRRNFRVGLQMRYHFWKVPNPCHHIRLFFTSSRYILIYCNKNVANIVRICFSVFRNYLSCACKNRLYTLVDRSFALNDTAQRRQWGLSGGSTVVSNDRAHRRRRQWGLSAGGVEAACAWACASKQVSKSVSNCTNDALRWLTVPFCL